MIVRRPGFTLLGAALALVAMFGLSALSGWHSAIVHDHAPPRAASVEHPHGTPDRKDSDSPIHIMAHATSQWLAVGGQPLVPAVTLATKAVWVTVATVIRASFDPSRLLRPPRG